METDTIAVLTYRGVEDMLHKGGSDAWEIDPERAKNYKYLVCVRNRTRKDRPPEGPEPHSHAFLIAKISGAERLQNNKTIILFKKFILVDREIKLGWQAKKYWQMGELGFDEREIELEFLKKSRSTNIDTFNHLHAFSSALATRIDRRSPGITLDIKSPEIHSNFVSYSTNISNLRFEIYYDYWLTDREKHFWCGFTSANNNITKLIQDDNDGLLVSAYEYRYRGNEFSRDFFVDLSEEEMFGIGYEIGENQHWIGIYKRPSDESYIDILFDLFERIHATLHLRLPPSNESLETLRRAADLAARKNQDLRAAGKRNQYIRRAVIRRYVIARAEGKCDCCKSIAPFKDRRGEWYLESHHIGRRSDGGLDHYRNMAAICPTCHRRIHYGGDGENLDRRLADAIQRYNH